MSRGAYHVRMRCIQLQYALDPVDRYQDKPDVAVWGMCDETIILKCVSARCTTFDIWAMTEWLGWQKRNLHSKTTKQIYRLPLTANLITVRSDQNYEG